MDAQHQAVFTKFPELPREIRLLIWEAALPGPRIVHLKIELFRSCDFGTRRVRSDKTLACDCLHCKKYAPGKEIEEHGERACTTADVAEEADNEDRGWNTDDDADPDEQNLDGPETLWGFRTKSPAPVVLFVCRESHEVGAKVYTRCFPSLGGCPTIWFNYQLDTLYLNLDSFSERIVIPDGARMSVNGLDHFNPEELAKVENLCFYLENLGSAAKNYGRWLACLLGSFGGVKSFHAITKHSTHSVWERDLTESEKWDLAIIEIIDIPAASLYYSSNNCTEAPSPTFSGVYPNIDMEILDEFRVEWNESEEIGSTWTMPTIAVGMVVSATIKAELEHRKRDWEARTGLKSRWPDHTVIRHAGAAALHDVLPPPHWWKEEFAVYMGEAV